MQLGSLWVRSRNFMAEFFDIVIVGGGPAGSTAGTLLAKHGWNVAILEKEKFPRFKIGLKFVTAWYTQEFAEVFFHPKEFFQLVPAVNSVLAGSEQRTAEIRWRLWVFDFLVFLQKRFALIAPRMNLQPK